MNGKRLCRKDLKYGSANASARLHGGGVVKQCKNMVLSMKAESYVLLNEGVNVSG